MSRGLMLPSPSLSNEELKTFQNMKNENRAVKACSPMAVWASRSRARCAPILRPRARSTRRSDLCRLHIAPIILL